MLEILIAGEKEGVMVAWLVPYLGQEGVSIYNMLTMQLIL
jgi:hypothetical protein